MTEPHSTHHSMHLYHHYCIMAFHNIYIYIYICVCVCVCVCVRNPVIPNGDG